MEHLLGIQLTSNLASLPILPIQTLTLDPLIESNNGTLTFEAIGRGVDPRQRHH